MVRSGKVVSSDRGTLKVCFERPEMCAKCGQCGQMNETLIEIRGNAEPGDRVDVDLPEGELLRVSAIAYIIPLIALLLGLAIGHFLFRSEIAEAVCSVVLTGVSLVIVILYDRALKKKQRHVPKIIAVHKSI